MSRMIRRTPTATHWGNYDVVTVDGRLDSIEPVSYDVDPSPIGLGMLEAHRSPIRITQPMVRKGWLEHGPQRDANNRGAEPFVALPWDQAVGLVAQELERVRREYGNEAIFGGSYGWASAGRFHHAQSQLHRFLNLIGGYTFSVNSYSAAAMEVILPRVIGGHPWSIWERGPMWREVADHGQLVVSFGGLAPRNTRANSGGVGVHKSVLQQRRCRAAGVRFVNVSPVRGDADEALEAEWISLRPNTDVAFMLGLAYVMISEELVDRDFLNRCCVGFERFAGYVTGRADGIPKDPRWAAAITGVDEATIRDLARRIAGQRSVINVSFSLQRAHHGEQTHWMGVTLAALAGSMGRPGGGFGGGLGAFQIGVRPSAPSVAAFPQGQNPVRTFIPVARITDMLLDPGGTYDYDGQRLVYPDIRLVYWAGGNPFHHHQDLNRLVGAWRRPETTIVHEPWWNALARFSDIVLPVATTLERNDFACGSDDVTISVMQKAVEPPPQVRTDYETFAAIAHHLGVGDEFTEGRTADDWVRELYEATRVQVKEQGVDIPPFDDFWALGRVEMEAPPQLVDGDFAALRADPQSHPLDTPSGRIEIYSETIAGFGYDDCPGHPVWLEPAEWPGAALAECFPLHLLSSQPSTRLHSQYDHGGHSQAAKVGGREPLSMHPADAAARRLREGDVVRVFNDRGACLAGLVLTESVRPGVVVLPTGAWYDPADPGGLELRGNPNVLTPDRGTSKLAQGPSPYTTLVEVEHVTGTTPPVTAFHPPAIEYLPKSPRSVP